MKKWNPEMADRKGFWYNTTDCVNVETLITEGTKAKPKEYPHMVNYNSQLLNQNISFILKLTPWYNLTFILKLRH